MENFIKDIIEEYQCPGCVGGSDISCFKKADVGLQCDAHVAGIRMLGAGRLFLGMPRGFNRLGGFDDFSLQIFNDLNTWGYDKFNIPVWKYFDENGNTLVRGISPRTNAPFLHVVAGNHIPDIDCLQLTKKDIEGMD